MTVASAVDIALPRTGSDSPVLEVRDVVKVYRRGRVRANDGISIDVERGHVFGLLGPNGAGKSTLISQIVGLAKPTSGSIAVAGVDVVANPQAAKLLVSYQPQGPVPLRDLKPREALTLAGQIRGLALAAAQARAQELIEMLDLGEWADRVSFSLSGGVGRLTSFALAMIAPGPLVVLDEPTNDVDPIRRELLWRLVRDVADAGSAVLLVTHNVLEAERVVDRLAIIDGGRIVAQGTPASMKASVGAPLRVELLAPAPIELPDFLTAASVSPGRCIAHVAGVDYLRACAWAYEQQAHGRVAEFIIAPTTLADIYREVLSTAPEDVE